MDFAGQTLIRSPHRERELKHSHNALEIAVEVTLPAQGARIETASITHPTQVRESEKTRYETTHLAWSFLPHGNENNVAM